MLRKAVLFTSLLALSAVSALAVPIVPSNLDAIFGSVGPSIVPEITDTFGAASPPPATIGAITNNVYFNVGSGIYTYTHAVTPSINNISEFNTAFGVDGFTNGGATLAGFSWGESAAAGGPGDGTGFSVELDPDGTIDWQLDPNNKFFDAGETITFFFQSTTRPGLGDYNLVNGEVGTATSYAPVPEPSTYLLFGTALGLFAWRRKKTA